MLNQNQAPEKIIFLKKIMIIYMTCNPLHESSGTKKLLESYIPKSLVDNIIMEYLEGDKDKHTLWFYVKMGCYELVENSLKEKPSDSCVAEIVARNAKQIHIEALAKKYKSNKFCKTCGSYGSFARAY